MSAKKCSYDANMKHGVSKKVAPSSDAVTQNIAIEQNTKIAVWYEQEFGSDQAKCNVW